MIKKFDEFIKENYEHDLQMKSLIDVIKKTLVREREINILLMKFGLTEDGKETNAMTFNEIGYEMGLTSDKVKQLFKKSMDKLKFMVSGKTYETPEELMEKDRNVLNNNIEYIDNYDLANLDENKRDKVLNILKRGLTEPEYLTILMKNGLYKNFPKMNDEEVKKQIEIIGSKKVYQYGYYISKDILRDIHNFINGSQDFISSYKLNKDKYIDYSNHPVDAKSRKILTQLFSELNDDNPAKYRKILTQLFS